MNDPDPFRGEDGAVLAITIVFVLVVSLVVSAMLSRAYTGFRTTQVVRSTTDKVYASDSGVEHAIETLRNNAWICAEQGDTASLDVNIDGRPVDIDCTTTSGASAGAAGWAVITTDPSNPGITSDGDATPTIEGPVFAANLGTSLDLAVHGGPLIEQDSEACGPEDAPQGTTVAPDPPFRYECATEDLPGPAPALPDTANGLGPVDPLPRIYDNDCAIFEPGTYTDVPRLFPENYFVSGTYYFHDIGIWTLDDEQIVGGARHPSVPMTESSLTPCPPDEVLQYIDPGYGVKFIFGGSSRLVLTESGAMELWPRLEADEDVEGTNGLSLQTVTETQDEFLASAGGASVLAIEAGSGQRVVHGMIHAPNRKVRLTASTQSPTHVGGGVVAAQLHLSASGDDGGGLSIGVDPRYSNRQVTITASTAGIQPGEQPATATAVVVLRNTDRSARVLSRRTTLGPEDSP